MVKLSTLQTLQIQIHNNLLEGLGKTYQKTQTFVKLANMLNVTNYQFPYFHNTE